MNVRMHPPEVELIDRWRAKVTPELSRPSAIRALAFAALEADLDADLKFARVPSYVVL